MEAGRISFLLRATYDTLPSPTNLHQWLGKDPACRLYDMPATLRHIVTGCKVSLSQGRYTWRHNQVLKSQAKRKATISNSPRTPVAVPSIPFVNEGEQKPRTTAPARKGQLEGTWDWEMFVDVSQQLIIPPYIATSTLRLEMVLWSNNLHAVYFIELTIPWEDATDEAFERKMVRYVDLKAEAEQRGWRAEVHPVELGCQGFIATSTVNLLKELGIRGQALHHTIKVTSDC